MEVGLVGVAALGRHQGGGVTSGETVSRVVETDNRNVDTILFCRSGRVSSGQPFARFLVARMIWVTI
jgi:hypothetical protein